MNTEINNRIQAKVPQEIVAPLIRAARAWEYSSLVDIFHCIQLGLNWWVGVVGDGENGGYEWFILHNGECQTSNCGYGCTEVALRDVLAKEVTCDPCNWTSN